MTRRYSIWDAAEDQAHEDGQWIMQGPWIDARHEPTLEIALEYLESCCQAMVDYGLGDDEPEEYYKLKDDMLFLDHLLYHLEPGDKWYNDVRELLFMLTLAGA